MKKKVSISIVLLSALFTVSGCSSPAANSNSAPAANTQSFVAATPQPATASTAESLVRDLYQQHNSYAGPFFQTKSRALVEKFFTPDLAELIWVDAVKAGGGAGAIDVDPVYGSEHTQIEELEVGQPVIKDEHATVTATFKNYEEKTSVTFSLKLVGGSWRIEDIKYPKGDTLLKKLQKGAAKR